MSDDLIAMNKRIEALWRSGKIGWAQFDWWLRTMNGV